MLAKGRTLLSRAAAMASLFLVVMLVLVPCAALFFAPESSIERGFGGLSAVVGGDAATFRHIFGDRHKRRVREAFGDYNSSHK